MSISTHNSVLCLFTSEPLNTSVKFLSYEVFDHEKLYDQAEPLITVCFLNMQMTWHHIDKLRVITGKTSTFVVLLHFFLALTPCAV
jgi:hypothetical protein